MRKHRIQVSGDVYDYLKDMIEDEHVQNGDNSAELTEDGRFAAHRPTFSEVIEHLIEDREAEIRAGGKDE